MSSKPKDFIKTQLSEGTKVYIIYNANQDISEYYEAPLEAINDAPCMRTQYKYQIGTRLLLCTKESVATWNSDWDFDTVVGE